MFLVLVVAGEHGIFLTTKISGFTVHATFFCFVSKTGRSRHFLDVGGFSAWLATSLMVNLPITRTYTSVHVQTYTINN